VRNVDRNGEPPGRGSGIFDAGLEAVAFASGPPVVCDEPAATSDEHGRLAVSTATNRLGLGDRIRLIPGHCNSTVYPHPSLPRKRGRGASGAFPRKRGKVREVYGPGR
jgi:D-serine deaminase-like pyridoxal phosphate-dependent protein